MMGIVVAATAIWPIGRWATSRNGSAAVMGFWISLFCGAGSAITLFLRGDPVWVPGVWATGLLLGLAYSIGFCAIIMHCIKIGPAGPTVTINNMAMACGVLYGVLWIVPRNTGLPVTVDPSTAVGLAGVCAALVLMGMIRKNGEGARPVTSLWLRLVAIGGLLSGLSFITQTHTAECYRGDDYLYLSVGFLFSAVVLLVFMFRTDGAFRRKRELIGGAAIGAYNYIALPLILGCMRELGAEVVLPVTVATPIILMVIIGRLVYKERIGGVGVAGCVIGAVAVALIAFGSAG